MKNIVSTKNLIYLSVFSAPLYLIKISLFGIPTNILEILISVTFLIWLWEKKDFSWKNFYNLHKKYLAGIFLIFLGLVISTLTNENYLTGLGIIKSWFVLPLILAFMILEEIKNKEEMENIFKALYFSAFIVSVSGLIYFLQGDLTYDFRLKAFYLSPNYLAMFLAPAIFIGNYLIISNLRLIKKHAVITLLLISQLIILLTIYFTYSYATWTAIILSLFILALIKQANVLKKTVTILVLLGLSLVVLITQLDNSKFYGLSDWRESSRSSLSSRVMIWKSAGKILRDNPLWGIGPGNFQNKYLEYQKYFPLYLEWAVPQPHSLYLAFWLQGGVLGLTGFLWLLFIWIKKIVFVIKNKTPLGFSLKSEKQKRDLKKISLVLLGIMFYVLLHGLADTTYWKNDLALVFWVVFSLGIIAVKHKDS